MHELALHAMTHVSGGLDSTTAAAMIAGTLSRAAAYTVASSLQGSYTHAGLEPSWTRGWIFPGIADAMFEPDTYRSRLPVAILYGTLAGYTDALEQRKQAAAATT